MTARFFCIYILAFIFSCSESTHQYSSDGVAEDMVVPSFELSVGNVVLPHIRYNVGEYVRDSVLEIKYLYIDELDDGVIWEEGNIRVHYETILRYGGAFLPLRNKTVEHFP